MQEVTQALNEVRDLYQKVLGTPAPDVEPGSYVSFPPGVDPLHHAIEEVHRLKQFSEQMASAPGPISWVPSADSFVADETFVIRLEVPGISRDDLKVFLAGGECVIRGQRKPPESAANIRPLSIERPWGPFERRFTLPAGSYPDRITARYADGVLEVRVATEGGTKAKEMKVEVE